VTGSLSVNAPTIYGNQNWFTQYRGVAPEYFDIKRWAVDQGVTVAERVTDFPDFLIVREVFRASGCAPPRYTL